MYVQIDIGRVHARVLLFFTTFPYITYAARRLMGQCDKVTFPHHRDNVEHFNKFFLATVFWRK